MNATDRHRLTTALRDQVAKVADEQVSEDFDVWTDLLARRVAVLWVLKSVFILYLAFSARWYVTLREDRFGHAVEYEYMRHMGLPV